MGSEGRFLRLQRKAYELGLDRFTVVDPVKSLERGRREGRQAQMTALGKGSVA